MKQKMTSFDVAAIIPEIEAVIKETRIRKIHQVTPSTLLFTLYKKDYSPLHLLIESGRRLHLTSYTLKKPSRPPTFCMALRKHLRNGRVKQIRQHEFDRVVILHVQQKTEEFQLVIELFSEGNIILLNSENRILQALVYRRMRDRNVVRNESFIHAPSSGKNPFNITKRDLEEIRGFGNLEIVRALTRFLSLGGVYAEEILLRANIDKTIPCNALTNQALSRIYTQTKQLLSTLITRTFTPRIFIDQTGTWINVAPLPLRTFDQFAVQTYDTVNEAFDEYFTTISTHERSNDVSQASTQELAKTRLILQQQKQTIEDLKATIVEAQKIGDAIYRHLHILNSLRTRILNERERGKTWEEIILAVEQEKKNHRVPNIFLQSMEHPGPILYLSVEALKFSLNLRSSIQFNANQYYLKAKKARKKMEGAKQALLVTATKLDQLQNRQKLVKETDKIPEKRRKKAWYEKFRWFHSSDGFLVLGGRDARSNELLIKKHLQDSDYVFHADVLGAPFVIVKTDGEHPPENTLQEAAQFAASYSRAWKEMLRTIDVYWVNGNQVRQTPPTGQYLRRGAFVISGQKHYLRRVHLQVAIGVKYEKEQILVIGGPPNAIIHQTNVYVTVIPGEQKSGTLAKEIRHFLSAKASPIERDAIAQLPLEDIQRFTPLGRGTIEPSNAE